MEAEAVRCRRRGVEEWRDVLARFDRSGQELTVFCAAENVSVASFHRWRRRLSVEAHRRGTPDRSGSSPLLDRGALRPLHGAHEAAATVRRLELKRELGEGLVLHLVRG